jgi:hypothetical protein
MREMYPRIPRELVADPLGSAEHSVGTTNVWRLLAVRCVEGSVGSVLDIAVWATRRLTYVSSDLYVATRDQGHCDALLPAMFCLILSNDGPFGSRHMI